MAYRKPPQSKVAQKLTKDFLNQFIKENDDAIHAVSALTWYDTPVRRAVGNGDREDFTRLLVGAIDGIPVVTRPFRFTDEWIYGDFDGTWNIQRFSGAYWFTDPDQTVTQPIAAKKLFSGSFPDTPPPTILRHLIPHA